MSTDRTPAHPPRHAAAALLSASLLPGMVLAIGLAGMFDGAHAMNDPPVAPPTVQALVDSSRLPAAGKSRPLHIEGNRIVGVDGRPVRLRGVNIASLEWTDTGENVARSLAIAIDEWRCNIVRIPLSQDRWFGRSPTQNDGGKAYRAIVDSLVVAAARRGAYILLDLHWSDADAWGQCIGQHKMPDLGSLLFWQDLGRRYANHPAVLMGLYNEPHDISWDVWLKGGEIEEEVGRREKRDATKPRERVRTTVRYLAVGHQELYHAVRAAGATENIIVVGGLDWAYDLAGLVNGYAIQGKNVLYDTHVYPNKDWKPEFSWENAFLKPSRTLPVFVGEWGGSVSRNGEPGFVEKLVQCLRSNKQLSWTAWDLHPSAGPTLIHNWNYEPTKTGRIVINELKSGRE